MSFSKKMEKVLTNKYFLYFIAFLSATNVLGYLVMDKVNAVVFFALVGLIMSNFSKNMSIVLLVCLVSTNLLMSNKMVREGLTGATAPTLPTGATAPTGATPTLPTTTAATPPATPPACTDGSTYDASSNMCIPNTTSTTPTANDLKLEKAKITHPTATADITQVKNAINTKEASGFTNLEPSPLDSNAGKKGSRIDLAGSLKSQFAELQNLLGPDGVKGLTKETMELMDSQKNLMGQMNDMGPMLSQAQEMLNGFDMDSIGGLGDMLKQIGPNKK